MTRRQCKWLAPSALALSLLLGWQALWLNLVYILMVAGIVGFYKKRVNCITGDMLGAMTEVTESLLFLFVAAGAQPW